MQACVWESMQNVHVTPKIAQADTYPHTLMHSNYTPSQLAWCSPNIVC